MVEVARTLVGNAALPIINTTTSKTENIRETDFLANMENLPAYNEFDDVRLFRPPPSDVVYFVKNILHLYKVFFKRLLSLFVRFAQTPGLKSLTRRLQTRFSGLIPRRQGERFKSKKPARDSHGGLCYRKKRLGSKLWKSMTVPCPHANATSTCLRAMPGAFDKFGQLVFHKDLNGHSTRK
jgi:hypothetical protein